MSYLPNMFTKYRIITTFYKYNIPKNIYYPKENIIIATLLSKPFGYEIRDDQKKLIFNHKKYNINFNYFDKVTFNPPVVHQD